jgi:hypothetical protein
LEITNLGPTERGAFISTSTLDSAVNTLLHYQQNKQTNQKFLASTTFFDAFFMVVQKGLTAGSKVHVRLNAPQFQNIYQSPRRQHSQNTITQILYRQNTQKNTHPHGGNFQQPSHISKIQNFQNWDQKPKILKITNLGAH